MEPEPSPLFPYLLVFRDCSHRDRSKTSPREEIGKVLAKWIDWHDSLEAQGKIRFRGAIGAQTRRTQGSSDAGRYQILTQQTEPVVGYLIIDAANVDEASEIAAGCPGLEQGFSVEVCEPFAFKLSATK